MSRVSLSGAIEGEYLVRQAYDNGILELVAVPDGGVPAVVSLRQTCPACPSQWEGHLDDDRWLYARYRGGYLRVGLGATIDDAIDAHGSEALYEWHGGDCLDGLMETAELRDHLAGLLHFPDDLQVEGEPDWDAGDWP